MKNLMVACALALALTVVPATAFAAPLSPAPTQDAATEQEVAPCPRGYENCPWRENGAPCPQANGSCGGCARGGHGIACPLTWGQNLAGATLERLAPLYALAQNAQTACPADGVNCPRHGEDCPNAACPADGIDCPRHGDACPNATCPADGVNCPRHGDACPNLANPEGDTELDADKGAGSNNGTWTCPRNGNGSNDGTWDCPGNGRHGLGHGCGRGCR